MKLEGQDLESILAAAVEIESAAERQRFIQEACGADAELKHRVEQMIDNHFRAGSFLESPAAGLPGGDERPGMRGGATFDEPIAERPGTVIGPYKLLQQIGEGGMGVVWMAEQTQPVQRKVALKVIKPGMDSRQVIARFEAERQALAMMDHVNIARVFDGGTTGEVGSRQTARAVGAVPPADCPLPTAAGRPYFVMELVHGVPITKYCDDNHLTPRERLELFVPVCQAIQHAHQKGIIHRDIKPSNVMVTLYDGKPVPKVIDFGVAKATEQKLTERTLFTQYGTMVGTLEYMSHEQAEMSALGVDTRSDIYSLGVLLYELLTGSTPLTHKRMKEAAYAEILRMIKEEEPPKPSTRLSDSGEALASISANRHTEPAKLTKLVKGELDWIVMKTLEKDRNRRYETAKDFATDVQRYLNDEPVQAGPPSAGYRLRKFVKRNRGPVLAAAFVLLALVGGILGTTWGLVEARHQRAIAEGARQDEAYQRAKADDRRLEAEAAEGRAKKEANKVEAINEFLVRRMLLAASPEIAQGRKLTVEEVLKSASKQVDAMFADHPDIRAAIHNTLGEAYLDLGLYDEAGSHWDRAVELSVKHLGDEHPDTLSARNNQAIFLFTQAKLDEAEAQLRQIITTGRRVLGSNHVRVLRMLGNLALVLMKQNKLEEAEAAAREALDARQRLGLKEDGDALQLLNALANIFESQSKLAKAEPVFRQALGSSLGLLGKDHPGTLIAMNNLAVNLQRQKKPVEAEKLFRATLEGRQRVLGKDHPYSQQSLRNLANLQRETGKLTEVEPLLRQLLEIQTRVPGTKHPQTLGTMSDLAMLLHGQGKHADAEGILEEALEIGREVLRPDHQLLLIMPQTLAGCYSERGKFAEAEKLFREVLELRRKVLPPDHWMIADSSGGVGGVLLLRGKPAEAESHLREALEIYRKALPKGHWAVASTQSLLGASLAGQKKYAEAEPLLLTGYSGLKAAEGKMPGDGGKRIIEALERLVQLYEAWEQKDKAGEWRKKLEAAKTAQKSADK